MRGGDITNKNNILFITDSYKQLSGGLKQLYLNAIGLLEKKYQIYLAAKNDAGIVTLLQKHISGFLPLDFSDYKSDGRQLAKFIKNNQIDIVHTFHNKGHKVGVWAKKYNSEFKLFVNRGVDFVPTNLFYYLNPKIDGYICNSHSVANKLKRILIPAKKINVLYNAFTIEGEFHENSKNNNIIKSDKLKICTIASGAKWKGFDYTLKSINEVNCDFDFYVLGVDKKNEYMQLQSSDAAKKTHWLGRRKDIIPILSKMDLFIYTPVSGDSCPNVILEAMFAGLPVISTNVGGIPELVKHEKGGMIVKKKDYKCAARNIELILKDDQKRKNMRDFNKGQIGKYSLERKISGLLKIYKGENIKETI
ncbi:glycosyl transferase group 1 [Flexistipes sinusarabici DSM 4947]|uniref:Glycosyl transferase group 1 n=1 Tax=Flexistipes sinusarabici (strain ATCC 49648 / DSM 4947 / MAS 10) TaxID=717231 RepID=F8E826_FLESM|nr:glycosyl transferase group 1 [Flexistipes sinusarabici DSM 4947]